MPLPAKANRSKLLSTCAPGPVQTADVPRKDAAAERWCENAAVLTGTLWRYRTAPQKDFRVLRPSRLAVLGAILARIAQANHNEN